MKSEGEQGEKKRPTHIICVIILVMAPCHPNVDCYFSKDTEQLKPTLLFNGGGGNLKGLFHGGHTK